MVPSNLPCTTWATFPLHTLQLSLQVRTLRTLLLVNLIMLLSEGLVAQQSHMMGCLMLVLTTSRVFTHVIMLLCLLFVGLAIALVVFSNSCTQLATCADAWIHTGQAQLWVCAGPVPMPGFMPQPWWAPPAGPLPCPNSLQLPGGRPVPMMHASSGMPFASPVGYQAMSGACVPVS